MKSRIKSMIWNTWKQKTTKQYKKKKQPPKMRQEAQGVPTEMDAKRPTPSHITIKMPKVKDKEGILKAAREKQLVMYSRTPIRLSADFSKETAG